MDLPQPLQAPRPRGLRRWARQVFHRPQPYPQVLLETASTNPIIPPAPSTVPDTEKPQPPTQPSVCDICTDPEATAGSLRSICHCSTQYCSKCIKELFIRAIKSPTNMPAKCCEMVPIHVALKYLTKEEAAGYRSKFEEWKTDAKDRVYCPKQTCSAFIPLKQLRTAGKIPDDTKSKEKRDSKDPVAPSTMDAVAPPLEPIMAAPPSIDCPKCTAVICVSCKSFAHPLEPCKAQTQNDEMLALLVKWGYKRCPRCGHGTRKMFGCSHMQCVCGAHWCWGCERGFNECERRGGCEWDEGDEDEDVYVLGLEDEEEEVGLAETVAGLAMEGVEPMDVDGAHEDMNATDVVTGPLTERESRRQRRQENLDAGGGRYWERQDLNFGSEPGDAEDGVWGCEHRWNVRAGEAEEGMECHQCWASTSENGQTKVCEWCGLLACHKCAEEGE